MGLKEHDWGAEWLSAGRSVPVVAAAAFFVLFILGSSPAMAAPPRQDTAAAGVTVRIIVTGLRNNKGTVFCKLYDSTADFPSSKPKGVRNASAKPQDGKAVCTYRNIPKGRYAVAIAHDENGNRKVDRTLIGIPKEGYGFSAGARPSISGAPSFKKAGFAVRGDTSHTIRIINP